MTDEDFMTLALKEAIKAAKTDEVPVGAVLVNPQNGEVVAKAHNQSEHGADITAHAEILAMRRGLRKLGSKRLWDCDLYVTLEPCPMCAAAISFARIRRLIYGAADPKGGAIESGVQFYQSPTCHHKPEVVSGVMAADCGQILKDFFKKKRQNAAS